MNRPAGARVSIVLTNYNGLENLKVCLPSVVAAGKSPLAGEIVLVDDCSDDGSVEWVRENHPEVRVLPLTTRNGFQGAANAGFTTARHDLVALLSSDMTPSPDFLETLVPHFDDPRTFAVASQLLEPDGSAQSGRTVGCFLTGNLMIADSAKGFAPYTWLKCRSDVTSPTLYTGGNALYDREKFRLLGGFDTLYHPFYWEDVDLCFRAWKAGYQILFEPRSRVSHHQGMGTIRRYYSRTFAQTTRRRNRLLFTWKNVRDPIYLLLHLTAVSVLFLTAWIWRDWTFYRSLWEAICRAPRLRHRHADPVTGTRMTDRQVFRHVCQDPWEPSTATARLTPQE